MERTTIGVIPVTPPSQILLDLAAAESRLAEGALNDALRRKLVQMARLLGWTVIRVTWLDLHEGPDKIAAQIAAALGIRVAA